MSEPLPTFANDRDRLTFLLARYRVPLSITILAAGVWVAWASPDLPSIPDKWADVAVAAALLALPLYAVGLKIGNWVIPSPHLWVGIADPGTNSIYDGRAVHPDIWAEKTVTGPPPLDVRDKDGCFDVVVTRFNWYEEIGEIEVRGVEEQMDPATLWESRERVDELYEHHHAVRRAYSRMKGTIGRYATELHDAVLMQEMAANEDAQLSPDVSVTSIIEDMEEEVEGMPEPTQSGDNSPLRRAHGLDPMDPANIPEASDGHGQSDEQGATARTEGAADGGRER